MNLNEIKKAISEGKRVFHNNLNYEVVMDKNGKYLIKCNSNNYCIGLTWLNGTTLNGKEKEFFTI